VGEPQLTAKVAEVLDRWPSAGLAVGVVRQGALEWFLGHGLANIAPKTPVTQDTVFRIGSLTKTMTAVAVMQLWEHGLVDLDAPASNYLRSFRLVPARTTLRPVTIRHLLTHTSGIAYWRRWSDLLRPGVGSGVHARRPVRSLADYYRRGLPVEIQPGTKWVYSNHGFATLGQIVEDTAGEPFDCYLRDHVFAPLGMEHTDLVRSQRVTANLATGFVLGSRGIEAAVEGEVPAAPSGAVYSTARDMARYVVALLGGGRNDHGAVLEPETVASMLEPHFQADPRVPGMGLSFELGELGGHRIAAKSGILSGFLSDMVLAPDDGIGVFVLTNTGRLDGFGAHELIAEGLLRQLLGLPADAIRTDIPVRPETWSELCGWYGLDRGPLTNVFDRLMFGAGAEVTVQDDHLMLRPLTILPSIRRGFRLHPDDEDDPYVFRIDFGAWGKPTFRVVFRRGSRTGATAFRLEGASMSMQKRPDALNPKRLLRGAVAGGGAALAIRRGRRAVRGAGRAS
jgi:CubicO group peptidase (beta-lactamase class C family)